MEPVWRNARTCLKPGIFLFSVCFFVGVCLLFCNHFIHNDCNVLGSDGQEVYWRVCCFLTAHWCLHLWRGWAWKCECECDCLFFCFFFFSTWNHDCVDTLLNLTYFDKVFGAGQLDVAAKAVSARFDTLWYLKGTSENQVLNVVFAVHSCLQLLKLNAPVDTTIPE